MVAAGRRLHALLLEGAAADAMMNAAPPSTAGLQPAV
jgi:hypothetical protein